MNYGFYISSTSTRLIKFINQSDLETLKKIKLVFSEYQVGSELLLLLKKYNIDYLFCDYGSLPGSNKQERNRTLSNVLLNALKTHDVDYCFTYGSHLLSGRLLEEYKHRLINFHPAILPMYPGLKAIDKAVEHGNTFLVGNTVHFIDDGMDTGMIIMQSVIPMQAFLQNKEYDVVLDLQLEMLQKTIKILENNMLYVENNHVLIRGADYTVSNIYPQIP